MLKLRKKKGRKRFKRRKHYKCINQKPLYFKVELSPSKKNYVICLTESLLKMMEKAFYFILKAVFILKIFKFLSRLFGHVRKNGLIRKIRLTSKFIRSQSGLQTIATYILPDTSQNKENQADEFD